MSTKEKKKRTFRKQHCSICKKKRNKYHKCKVNKKNA